MAWHHHWKLFCEQKRGLLGATPPDSPGLDPRSWCWLVLEVSPGGICVSPAGASSIVSGSQLVSSLQGGRGFSLAKSHLRPLLLRALPTQLPRHRCLFNTQNRAFDVGTGGAERPRMGCGWALDAGRWEGASGAAAMSLTSRQGALGQTCCFLLKASEIKVPASPSASRKLPFAHTQGIILFRFENEPKCVLLAGNGQSNSSYSSLTVHIIQPRQIASLTCKTQQVSMSSLGFWAVWRLPKGPGKSLPPTESFPARCSQ